MADQPTCLCIVSGERLRGGDFIAALRASLRPHDQLEIIVDRRCGEPVGEWERLEDRRHRPQVDAALRANGFAVIPAPSSREDRGAFAEHNAFAERSTSSERGPVSLLLPAETSSRGDDRGYDRGHDREYDREYDEDEERLEAIRDFKRERSSHLVPWLIAALVVVAALAFLLSPTGQTLRTNLAQRIWPASDQGNQTAQPSDDSSAPRGPAVAERSTTAPARPPASEAPSAERSGRGSAPSGAGAIEPAPPRDAGGADARESATGRENTVPRESSVRDSAPPREGTAPPRESRVPPRESAAPRRNSGTLPRENAPIENDAPSRATTGAATRTRPRAGEPVRSGPSAPSPRETASVAPSPEAVSRTVGPRFAGLPRIELMREGGASGGSYSVRIADPAGKPLPDAEVLLIARMADGTTENVRMGFVPEHGTYRGMLPPVRSAPIDLRVRVITGDKRVEIPVGP